MIFERIGRRMLPFLIAAACSSPAVRADPVSEYDMKATYTFNFAAYTEWPESNRANFNICTLNNEEMGLALLKLDDKRVHGRRIVIARLSSMVAIRQCQILLIGEQDLINLPRIIGYLGDASVMTVSDVPALSSVCASMSLEGQRLVFDINLERCQHARLKPSSVLLRLARTVQKAP